MGRGNKNKEEHEIFEHIENITEKHPRDCYSNIALRFVEYGYLPH